MCQVIIYTRVSSKQQALDGFGLEAQEDACRSYAAILHLPVGGVFHDAGVSGATPPHERAGLMAAIAALSDGDVLLVAKRDRLARDLMASILLTDLATKAGASIVSAAGEASDDQSPTGQFIRNILDAVSQYERAVITARMQGGKRAMRARGMRSERITQYGYGVAKNDDKQLVINDGEAQAIQRMIALRAEGLSLRAISAKLAEEGVMARNGKPYAAKVIMTILDRQPA